MKGSAVPLVPHRKYLAVRLLFRYISGRPLDGRFRTDSSFFQHGTQVFTQTGRATPWAKLAGWQRAAWRLGVPAGVLSGTWTYLVHPWIFWGVLATIAATATTVVTLVVIRVTKTYTYRRTVRTPLTHALAPVLDMSPAEVDQRLVLPGPGRTLARIPLPDHFQGRVDQRKDIERIVSQRIGGEWDVATQMQRAPFYLRFTPRPSPPAMVRFAEVRAAMQATTPDKPLLGLGSRGEPIYLDFSGEIAHLGISMGTGAGKSTLLRSLVAQFAHHGCASIDVCDTKFVSLQGLEPIRGLRTHRTVEEITTRLRELRTQMDVRYQRLLKNSSATFPRMLIILEEQNSFALEAKEAWKESGGKGRHPVWSDLLKLILKGRQVNITVIAAYQEMRADACGGAPEIRASYGMKILGEFTHQMWDMLVGTRPRATATYGIKGRAVAVMGTSQRSVQVPLITVAEALEFATSGVPVTVPDDVFTQVAPLSPVTVTPAEPRYRLADAAREPWCEISYPALKQRAYRARRDGLLTPSDDDHYTRAELAILIGPHAATESETR